METIESEFPEAVEENDKIDDSSFEFVVHFVLSEPVGCDSFGLDSRFLFPLFLG